MDLTGKEPIDLPLVCILGCEGCCSHLARLLGDWYYLVWLCHCDDVLAIKKNYKKTLRIAFLN